MGRTDKNRRRVARIVWEIQQRIEREEGRPSRCIASKEIMRHPLMQALEKSDSNKKSAVTGARDSGYLEPHPHLNGGFWLTEKGRKVAEEYGG